LQCWPDAREREKNERGEKRACTTGSKKRSAAAQTTTIGVDGGGGGGVSFSQTPQKQVPGRGSDDEAGDESDARPVPRIHNKQYGTIIYNGNIIYVWSR